MIVVLNVAGDPPGARRNDNAPPEAWKVIE
jgi:hypothetical protein